MSLVLCGISVSRGVVIGKAALLRHDELETSEYTVPRPLLQEEATRYRVALRNAKQQLKAIRRRIPEQTRTDIVAFIDAHLLMLDDGAFSEVPVKIIKQRQCNAEWALKLQRDALVRVFDEMEDPYLKTRKDDVDHVVTRIQRNLQSTDGHPHEARDGRLRGAVLIADDISPADTVLMQQQGVAAFVTEYGASNSHTAIMARSMGIPAIVGVHHVRRYIRKDELVVIDARHGTVTATPDKADLEFFRRRQRDEKRHVSDLNKLRRRPAVTRDGHPIKLMANIEVAADLAATTRAAAAGVGLFRTEMLFINRERLPDEEEQYEAYVQALRALKGAPVTIRTLDLGADKELRHGRRPAGDCTNPAMGLRAIRWSLRAPAVFARQVRAILRSSAQGPVRMMIPMLSTLSELRQIFRVIDEEKADLRRHGIPFDPEMPVGGMIEVPAAALAAGGFASHLDFLSLGTNDLIQYALAVDRLDEEVNYLYDPLHPAILKLIRMTIEAGGRAGIPVSMCGEMAGEPRFTRLLLGLGLRELSMYPATLLEVKQEVANCEVATLSRYAKRALRMKSSEEVAALVDRMNRL